MARQPNNIAELNKRSYAKSGVVSWYEKLDFLHPAEAVILEKLRPFIKDRKVLDIGIGGGRTTKFLLDLGSDYTGIDYTPGCVAAARRKYPAAHLFCCDARDLSQFSTSSFGFVMFSLNGLDYVSHEDRLRILGEIRRVLQPGGFFVFSTHNRDYRHFHKLPWQAGTPFNLNLLKSCLYTLAFLPRHLRMRRYEVHADEYLIVNDNAHGFSLLTYYIGIEQQRAQLVAAGFADIHAYDLEGVEVESDQNSAWTYYLASKPGTGNNVPR